MSESNGKVKPMNRVDVGSNLLDLIDRATEDDLAALDAAIETLNKKLAALQGARKMMDVALHGVTKRKYPARKSSTVAASAGTDAERGIADKIERRRRIADLLSKTGPLPAGVIAEKLGLDGRGIGGMLQYEWFEQTGAGYRLTSIGRREALGPVSTAPVG
jgi:hypothetical protein